MSAMMMPANLLTMLRPLGSRNRAQGRIDIVELAQKNQEAPGCQQRPDALPDGSQHDRAGDRLKSAHHANDGLESIAADVGHRREVENQMDGPLVRRGLHQLIQFVRHQLVDFSLRAEDRNASVAFNGYRHGVVISLARDDCRRAVMKVHSDLI